MSEKLIERLKGAAIKGVTASLKAVPIWVEAIGVGALISTVVADNPAFKEKLGALDGKVFLFEAVDISKRFYLRVEDRDIKVELHRTGPPDVTMKGDASVLMEVFLGRVDPDTVFFSRRLEITGDTAAAIHLKNILATLS